MRIGLITDIHERVEDLQLALKACDSHGAEQILCLGDLVERGHRLGDTVAVLAERRIQGVWGNHDFGLCSHPSAQVSSRRPQFAGPVLDYFATYRPSLEIEDCHFSHVEPWRDLNDVMGLWCCEGVPASPERVQQSLAACAHRVLFTGHIHRWICATANGVLSWDGRTPLILAPPERYLIVVGAVCEGSCAVYDTKSCELTPIAFRPDAGPRSKSTVDGDG